MKGRVFWMVLPLALTLLCSGCCSSIPEDVPIRSSLLVEPPRETGLLLEMAPEETEPPEETTPETQIPTQSAEAEENSIEKELNELELLEKWMAVEGLRFADLDERGCRQLVLAVARETDGVQTYTTCYEKQAGGTWVPVQGLVRMEGWTGSSGINHNRERGDMTSPAGLWGLGMAFGNSPRPEGLKMPWRDVTPNSDWVTDANSPYFNTWQERDDPSLTDTWDYEDVEHLENYPNSYAYACVIEYNLPPETDPDRGCAIFFHCGKGPTEGCIGLPEADFLRTLLWLDPEENPCILITGYEAPHTA